MRIFFLRINRKSIFIGLLVLFLFFITILNLLRSLEKPSVDDRPAARKVGPLDQQKIVAAPDRSIDVINKAAIRGDDDRRPALPELIGEIGERKDAVIEKLPQPAPLRDDLHSSNLEKRLELKIPPNMAAIEDSADAIHKAANIHEENVADVLPVPVDIVHQRQEQRDNIPEQALPSNLENEIPADIFPRSPPNRSDSHSVGPGEGGVPFVVDRNSLSAEEKAKYDLGLSQHAFAQYESSKISVRRYLPDMRDDLCKTLKYPLQMMPATIIITFHQEDWTVLLRSVHSIFDRSPPELIHEVILVDDASSYEHLKRPLEIYMSAFPKVKIVRAKERQGLIRARMVGTKAATGRILLFLDSHIECTEGWLPPLLHRIAENKRNVVVPVIDVISKETIQFSHSGADQVQVGGFDWGLQFRWHHMPKREAQRPGAPVSPIKTPTMAGGLFAISYDFFEELGWYDPGYEVWGAENLELSFKTWMCGGTLETIPCSHVGHIFRTRSPYSWQVKQKNPLRHNLLRLAETLLDEYKYYYFARVNFQLSDMGDVSDRKAILENLHCRPFKWYVQNIYPEMFDPSTALASGDVRNADNTSCIDAVIPSSNEHTRVGAFPCHQQGGNQFFLLSKDGEILRDDHCADTGYGKNQIHLADCHGGSGNQFFRYSGKEIISVDNLCVTLTADKRNIVLQECDGSQQQSWTWERKGYKPFNNAVR